MAGKRVTFESVLSSISSLVEPFEGRTEHSTVFKLPHPAHRGWVTQGTCPIRPIVRNRSMHFHRIGVLLLCLLAAAISSPAQEKSDAATIRALEMKWTESYKQHNIDILSSLLAEDFAITIEDGSVYSKAGYISHSADPCNQCAGSRTVRPQGAHARRHRHRHRGVSRER